MKRMKAFLFGLLILSLCVNSSFAVDEWLKGTPAGSINPGTIDTVIQANNEALDRGMAYERFEAGISYSSASQLSVAAGSLTCSNSGATVRRMRVNTSSTTVTWSDIDTGAEEASTTYYIYAVADVDQADFTIKISKSSSAPGSITYYKRLGSFYNNGSSNITNISNDGDERVGEVYDYSTSASSFTVRQITGVKFCYGSITIGANTTATISNLPYTSSSSYVIFATFNSSSTGINEDAAATTVTASTATVANGDGSSQSINWWTIGI